MSNRLETFAGNVEQFVQLTNKMAEDRAKLFSGDDELSAVANHLVEAARLTHDQALSDLAANIEASVLLVRAEIGRAHV